ncbi:DNA polymerase, partial [Mesorhizobium sp. M7A.F.Ca.US.011.01.1.1]
LPHGRGDEAHHGGPGLDSRSLPKGFRPRDLVDPTLKVEPIKVKTRDFK